MNRKAISAEDAPDAIGPYSHAIRVGNSIFMSGQIALNPKNMELVSGSFRKETKQVFANISAVVNAAGGSLQDIVKLTVYLTDLKNFDMVNAVMSETFQYPFPARVAIGVSALPRGATIEVEALAILSD
ncbi:MAG: RidA family protein [Gammaproteobacteria bacterium]|nr:RidA family protein [Gammaproteobacteria bacterium]MYD80848.1 RidA family protein [Gammaproteobacteria bacterium]